MTVQITIPEFHCQSLGELKAHAEQFTERLGFAHFGLVCKLKSGLSDGRADLRFMDTCPLGWRHAIRDAIDEGKPHILVRHAALHLPALGWSASGHTVGHAIVDDTAVKHVKVMRTWGIEAGMVCPIAAEEVEWGAVIFLSRRVLSYDDLQALLPACYLYASHVAFWYFQLSIRRDPDRPKLTKRESECLTLAARGMTAAEIGDALGISVRTVETHLASACDRLNARGRQAAIAKASELKLLGGKSALVEAFEKARDQVSTRQSPTEHEMD